MNTKNQLTLTQAFRSIYCFLNFYYFNFCSDDLGSILTGFKLFKDDQSWEKNPQTWDPSAWSNWINTIQKTFPNQKIKLNETTISTTQAFDTMISFINHYQKSMNSTELKLISKTLQKITISSTLWKYWILCIHKICNEKLPLCDDMLICTHTQFNTTKSLEIMINFSLLFSNRPFKNFAQELFNLKLHLSNNEFTCDQQLFNVFFHEQKKITQNNFNDLSITLLPLFKLFYALFQAYESLFSSQESPKLLEILKYYPSGLPKNYTIYYKWQQATYKTYYPLVNG